MQRSFSMALVAIVFLHGINIHASCDQPVAYNKIEKQDPENSKAFVTANKQTSAQNKPNDTNAGGIKKLRSFDHHSYEIIDTSYFIVYYRQKAVEKIPNKGVMMVAQYYFSKTADDAIYELNIDNLKKIFPALHHFHYLLEEEFRSDKQLMDYDTYLKEYKLKYIFSQSLN